MKQIVSDTSSGLIPRTTSTSDGKVDIESARFKNTCRIKALDLAWEDERSKSENHYVDQAEAIKKADVYFVWLIS